MNQTKFKNLGRSIAALLVCVLMQTVQAQNVSGRKLDGVITNEQKEPLQGVVIEDKKSSTSVLTDASGKFSINVTGKGTLNISFTGYSSQTVAYTENSSTLSISLEIDTKGLDEVVVVGYATVKRKDVTGAVAGIGSKDIKSRPVTNAVQAMQGKVAGVDISSNERPGTVGSINIRGVRSLTASNSPLFVVDGIPLTTGGIDNLNPQDIESIDVLKDASATAIFGSRGANGVIIVTTKQGKSGKVVVNFNSNVTSETLNDSRKMFNAGDYITYRRWAYYYAGLNQTTGVSTYPRGDQPTLATDRVFFNATGDPTAFANIEKGWASGTWDGSKVTTTDWGAIVKQNSITSDNLLSVSGGTDKLKAYASLGYLNNVGTIKGQSFERYTAKVNLDFNATSWFSLGSNLNINYNNQQFGQSGRGVATIGSPQGGLYESSRTIFPYALPYDADGERILFPGGDNAVKNVVDEWKYNIDSRTTLRTFGSIYTQLNLGSIVPVLKGLKYRMNFGPDISQYENGAYIDSRSVANGGSTSWATVNNERRFSYTLDHLLYYDKSIGEHTFGLTLLNSQTAYKLNGQSVTGNGVPLESQRWNALTSGVVTGQLTTASNLVETQLLSYMARLNYGYKDKYLLTVSARQDGASQLADGYKYSLFPSAALAWRVNQEKFMDNVTWVNDLKLRIGAGVTGNSAVSPYSTQGSIISLFYPINNGSTAGTILNSQLANQELGWEKTTQYNLGVDFQLLDRRLSGSIDVYKSRTTDLIMRRSIPSVTGYTTTFANIGETANRGIDISLTTVNVKSQNLTWSTTLNVSWQKDEIVSLANGKQDDIANNWFIGQPIGIIYGYKSLGLWQKSDIDQYKLFNANGNTFTPGSVRVEDLNGDNKIDANNDRQIIGWTRPRWVVGMTNSFSYKNFSLDVFIYGRLNYKYSYGGEVQAARSVNRVINYYNENNTNAEFQKPVFNAGGAAGDAFFSALGYLNADFLKIRNISMSYNLRGKSVAKLGMSDLRVFLQVQNPGMLTSKIKFIDMDVVGNTWNTGYTLGVNASF
jgi:TonB-linked SusC/RagA family outer membrane protein